MIKRLFSFTLHLLILLASLSAAAYLFMHWTGYFDNETFVAYLYDGTDFQMLEIDQMTEAFESQEVAFESAAIYGDVVDRAARMIEKGANTIILNLAESPADELIELAIEYDITLFFVGALPTETQLASHDKLWCFTESTAYAGELLGEQVAAGYRDGTITDKNEDLLLDFVFVNTYETYMETDDAVAATILELDHYGVYTTDLYAAAYSVAYAAAEQVAINEMIAAENEAAIASEGEVASDATEETAVEGEESEPEYVVDPDSLTVTVNLASIDGVEIAMSIGKENAVYLAEKAEASGWLDGTTPTALACIVENYAAAKKLNESGLYQSIVYFDTETATSVVVAMACNAAEQTPVTNGTEYAETASKTFVFEHKVY